MNWRRPFLDAWQATRDAGAEIRRRPYLFGTLAALVVGLTAAAFPYDQALSAHFRETRVEPWLGYARRLRHWGTGEDGVFLLLMLTALSYLLKKAHWRRAIMPAIAGTLAVALAVNIVRVGTGRPRPHANQPDRFTGPTLVYRHQSFPSGHTAAAFASGTILTVLAPPVGALGLASATGIAWASLYNLNHYLTDILLGGGTGIVGGLAFGLAARRRRALTSGRPPA